MNHFTIDRSSPGPHERFKRDSHHGKRARPRRGEQRSTAPGELRPTVAGRSGGGAYHRRVLSEPGAAVADLVVAVRAGGPAASEAWDDLVNRHVRLVWKVLHGLGLSGDDRGDAFQSTWLRAVERLDSIREPDRFPGWLATIAL